MYIRNNIKYTFIIHGDKDNAIPLPPAFYLNLKRKIKTGEIKYMYIHSNKHTNKQTKSDADRSE